MRGVDVPRVELDRVVVVELEPVPGPGQRLAAARLVDEESSLPSSPNVARRCAFSSTSPSTRTASSGSDDRAEAVRRRLDEDAVDDLAPREADRVDGRLAGRQQRPRPRLDLREVARRVLVDEPDRRARQDVVELLQQQQLPEPVELGAWVVASQQAQELDVVQQLLAAAVGRLDGRLRGVGAAVVLEVELADDGGRSPGSASSAPKNSSLVAVPRARQPLQVARAPQRLEHRRASARRRRRRSRRRAGSCRSDRDRRTSATVSGGRERSRPRSTCPPAGSGRAPRCRRRPAR